MENASRNDSGRPSVTDNNSDPAVRLPRVTTKVATPLHRAAVGRWCAMLLIAAGTQVLALLPLQAASTKREITDSGITAAVEGGLAFEKGVFPNDVDVSTSQGIVTLSGSVNNLLAKERAVKMAESIRGVRGVIDRTTVTPVSRSDADTRKDIQAALRLDPATESYRVAVSVQNAVATLTGSVGSYTEKELVARIAKGVKGIREVRNEVAINYLSKRTDSQIAADIKSRLQWDIWVNGDMTIVEVSGGKATLTGIVGSAIAKSRASDDAWVNGVLSVDASGMRVEPWAHNDAHRRLKYATRSDSDIKQAVQAAFRLDPRVAAFSLDVNVGGGVVVLSGNVGNLKAKTSAEQDVENIVGVTGLDSLVKVRPSGQSTDAEMKEQLKAVVFWDPLLDSSTISVAVVNRVAYLSGTVGSIVQKAEAQDVALRTKGVVLVWNALKVEPASWVTYYDWPNYYYASPYGGQTPYYASGIFGPQLYLSDERIKKNIENAFFWSPFVHSDEIKVSVDGGMATLTGTVGTWIGWGEADKDARRSGATGVVNRVKVKTGAWWW
jgi:osmotically-inducible protein OsmY